MKHLTMRQRMPMMNRLKGMHRPKVSLMKQNQALTVKAKTLKARKRLRTKKSLNLFSITTVNRSSTKTAIL